MPMDLILHTHTYNVPGVAGDPKGQVYSMIINLINLVKAITAQHLVLYDLSDALKDINEHRLTKVR
jgi:hypothetical protein